jgi:hypothetical protein
MTYFGFMIPSSDRHFVTPLHCFAVQVNIKIIWYVCCTVFFLIDYKMWHKVQISLNIF